jgi:hypothetical protein
MLRFPRLFEEREPPARRVSLLEYAVFCEHCLKRNPAITPENCLENHAREKSISRPFSLKP